MSIQGMPQRDIRMPSPGARPSGMGMVNKIPLGTGTPNPGPQIREASQQMPPAQPAPSAQEGGSNENMKKRLLQKLMSDLLNKPGRSVNEIINGIKAAIGAYKNYAKEWDTLNGVTPETGAMGNTRNVVPPNAEQRAKNGVIESWDKPNN